MRLKFEGHVEQVSFQVDLKMSREGAWLRPLNQYHTGQQLQLQSVHHGHS